MSIKLVKMDAIKFADASKKAKATKAIGQFLINQVGLEFKLGKDPFGAPWAPNAPSTLKRKLSKGSTGAGKPKVLIDTGNLRNSWTTRTTKNMVEIGTPVPYAKYHQSGTRKIPQRMLLPQNDKQIPAHWNAQITKILKILQ